VPKSLLEKVYSSPNLKKAWKQLNKSNRSSQGLSSMTIENFGRTFDSHRRRLSKELREGSFKFSKVKAIVLKQKKPFGEIKRRPIRVSEIQDRVVQRAIVNIIEPILRKKYQLRNIASFAYLEERDIRKALIRMVTLYKKGNPIVLEADIKNYFGTVNKEKLLNEMIFPALPDTSLNELIEQALNQEIGNLHQIEQDDWELFSDTGIPQGGGLSPLFANVYLNDFDKEMLAAGYGLVRYADDFIVVCRNEEEAVRAYEMSINILEKRLGLKLHMLSSDGKGKTRIVRFTQVNFEFLGIRFNGKNLYPGEKTLKNLETRIREITEFGNDKSLLNVLSKLKLTVEGWIAAHCYTKVEEYLPTIENELSLRLCGCAHRMGWIKNDGILSQRQRKFTGLPCLVNYLNDRRKNFTVEELAVFQDNFVV